MQPLTFADARVQLAIAAEPFHRWTLPDNDLFLAFYRTPTGYLLRFPELADFTISNDLTAICCTPAPEVPPSTCEHLYLNQIHPMVLERQGKLVLHGSAIADGERALAFLAPSGRGKSTLAAAFALDGCPFLTDDGLLLEPNGADYLAMPSHPSLRLWDDSHAALLPAGSPTMLPVHYTSKSRFVAGERLPFREQPTRLCTIYLLGPGETDDIELRQLEPGTAVAALLQHSFILDIDDRRTLGAHFDNVTRLANATACFHLDYPRCYETLPRVMRSILAHAASLSALR